MPRIRITARVLRPAPQEPVTFLVPIDPDATFGQIWTAVEKRYKENYASGRISNYYTKKIQDSTGADIDIRDTVEDIFGDISDPSSRIVQLVQLPIEARDTNPPDSNLHIPRPPLTPAQLKEIDKKELELARYGRTLDNLDPDHPVESHEPRPEPRKDKEGFAIPFKPQASQSESKKDKDGFAIPANTNRLRLARVIPTSHATQQSQDASQDAYEDDLAHYQLRGSVELGSPLRAPAPEPSAQTPQTQPSQASQYSNLNAVPSAQKPRTTRLQPSLSAAKEDADYRPPTSHAEKDSENFSDSISDDDQPRLSHSAVHKSATSEEANGVSKSAKKWSLEETKSIRDWLDQGKTDTHDLHRRHFPTRTFESVRKKVQSMRRSSTSTVKTPQQARRSTSNASANPTWGDEEESYFEKAIRKNQSWKTLRDNHFRHRSDAGVRAHYAEVRLRLDKEDEAKSSQERFQQQVQDGSPSTGPGEKFRQDEDDLLTACRIDNLEMSRAAKTFFPLRSVDQVSKRANTVYNNQVRAAIKAGGIDPHPTRSPSIEFLFRHDAAARDRVEEQRVHTRALKKKLSSERTKEFEQSSQAKARVAKDKIRAEERRDKEQRQTEYLDAITRAKNDSDSVKRRRLEDDLQRERAYKNELAAWEEQAEIDRKTGRRVEPRPAPPLGSSIGTEVIISDLTPSHTGTTNTPNQRTVQKGASQKSTTKQPATHPAALLQKRKASDQEVQVVIPGPSKKQKTDAAMAKSTSSSTPMPKAVNSPIIPAASSQKTVVSNSVQPVKTVPSSTQSRSQLSTHTVPVEDKDDEPIITFHSPANQNRAGNKISATQPIMSGAAKYKSHGALPQSSPSLPNHKHPKFVQSKLTKTGDEKTRRGTGMIDDSMFISSDSDSSYEDEDITDEELTALAERSEAMYSSSPAKEKAPETASTGQPAADPVVMRSSPPVASMPTPKPAPALKMSSKFQAKGKEASKMLDQIVADTAVSSGAKKSIRLGLSQPPDWSHQASSMPVSKTSAANISVVIDNRVVPKSLNDVSRAGGRQPPITLSAQLTSTPDTRSRAAEDQLREELARSTQPEESASQGVTQGAEAGETTLTDQAPIDDTEVEAASEPGTQNTAQSQSRPLGTDSKDVEDVRAWRSQTGDSNVDCDDLPQSKSPDMPFPKKKQMKFGPFRYTPTIRTPGLPSAKSSGDFSGEQSTSAGSAQVSTPNVNATPRSPSISNIEPPFPSSGKVKSPSPVVRGAAGPFSSPAGHTPDSPINSSEKKKRKTRRKSRQGGILRDAHLFAPPPSTAPPDLLSGGGLRNKRKQDDQPVTNGTANVKASASTTNNQQSKKAKKTASSQASPNISTKKERENVAANLPKKTRTPRKPKRNTSSTISATQATPTTDSAIRQADQRLNAATKMPSQEFWSEENIKTMNEEQVLAQMIEQNTQARLQEMRAKKSIRPQSGKVVDMEDADDDDEEEEEEEEGEQEETVAEAKQASNAGMIPATQPVRAKANWSTSRNDDEKNELKSASQPVLSTKTSNNNNNNNNNNDDSGAESSSEDADSESANDTADKTQVDDTINEDEDRPIYHTRLTQAQILDLELERRQAEKAQEVGKKQQQESGSSTSSSSDSSDDSSDEGDLIQSMEKLAAMARKDQERRRVSARGGLGGVYY